MSVYRHGAVGPVAEYAVKLYHSHWSVQKEEVEMAEAEWRVRDPLRQK